MTIFMVKVLTLLFSEARKFTFLYGSTDVDIFLEFRNVRTELIVGWSYNCLTVDTIGKNFIVEVDKVKGI